MKLRTTLGRVARELPASGWMGVLSAGLLVAMTGCSPDKSEPAGDGGVETVCVETADFISGTVTTEVFDPICSTCHATGRAAQRSALLLDVDQRTLADSLETVRDRLVSKPTGRHIDGHGGGRLLDPASPQAQILTELVGRLEGRLDACGEPTGDSEPPEIVPADCDVAPPGPRGLRRLSHVELAHTLNDLLGVSVDPTGDFAADVVVDGYANHGPSLTVTALLADQYRATAEALAETVELTNVVPCGETNRACATAFVTDFGRRVFRRPLTGEEVGRYLQIFDLAAQDGFETGIRWTLTALLQSPHFLYRTELGRASAPGHFELTSYELATALSYLVWQTTPDTELLELAASGDLLDPDRRAEQLARLLDDPRSVRTQQHFVDRWLGIDQLDRVSREGLDERLRDALKAQTDRLIERQWQSGALGDLLTTSEVWLDETLADHYGLEGAGWTDLTDTPYAGTGVLGHGAVLTTHSKPADSSPIHRGLLVRERLLCHPLPDPPANLDTSPPEIDPTKSTRERFAQHSADQACFGCHDLIDPIGFTFEHFDNLGRYRARDGEHAVDVSGAIRGDDPVDVDGLAELASALAVRDDVAECYAEQWVRFGLGVATELPLACYAHRVQAEVSDLRDVIPAIAGLPRFTQRTGEQSELDVPGAELTPTEPGDVLDPPEPVEPVDPMAPDPGPAGETTPGATLSIREDSRWGTGYCVSATVTNETDGDLTWVVSHDLEGMINDLWNAEASGTAGRVRLSGVAWNANLAPGASAEFGWCAQL